MKISELVYEVRKLARKEEDPINKDLFYQCAKSLEILGNLAKISDLAVAEHNAADEPSIDYDGDLKWNVDDVTLSMMDEHIDDLIQHGFMDSIDRWPYGEQPFTKFVAKYAQSHFIKDSKTE
jgi:hypothetical protein